MTTSVTSKLCDDVKCLECQGTVIRKIVSLHGHSGFVIATQYVYKCVNRKCIGSMGLKEEELSR